MKIKEMYEKIDSYFLGVTDAQLQIDLDKAGYAFYKYINVQLFSDLETNYFEGLSND
jgi:hypothetical protein